MYCLDIETDVNSILLELDEEQYKIVRDYIEELKSEIESKDEEITELEYEVSRLNDTIDDTDECCSYCTLKEKCDEIVNEEYRYIKTKYNDIKTIKTDLEHELRYYSR